MNRQGRIRLRARLISLALFAACFLCGTAVGLTLLQGEPLTRDETIARNTVRLTEVERRLERIENWQEKHNEQQNNHMASDSASFRELEVTVGAHEKLLWLIGTALIGLMVETIFSFVKKPKTLKIVRGEDNGG
jgi:hypothetical protein